MDYSNNQISEILLAAITYLHQKYEWYGEIEVDNILHEPSGKTSFALNLNKFTLYEFLLNKYKSNGYQDEVLINFLHSLLCNHFRYNDLDFFDLNLILTYRYKNVNWVKEINKKGMIYKIELI